MEFLNQVNSSFCKTVVNIRYGQYVSAFCVGILQVAQFVNLSWGSPTLPKLLAEDSPIGKPLTHDAASWVLSIVYIGTMVGNMALLVVVDRVGPKRVLLLGAVLTVFSWILLGLAKSFAVLIIGRVIAGIGDGLSLPCISIYVCEIASKDIRGKLAAIPVLIGVFGNLFIFGAGPYMEYTTLIISSAVFPIIFLIIFPFMPNSPYFLVKQGNKYEAEKSLMRLLNKKTPDEVKQDLLDVEKTVKNETGNLTIVQALLLPNFRRSLFITFVAHNLILFGGVAFMSSYLQMILAAGSISISKELTSTLWGLVKVIGVVLSALIVDKIGRKPLFFVSSLGACIAITIEGFYIYLQDTVHLESVSFLPVLCLTLYGFFVALGVLHLPYLLVGELFTAKTKQVASFIVMSYGSIIVFGNIKVFGSMFSSWGFHTIFWFFGAVCFGGVLFSLFMLPETKGKSFDEIQDALKRDKCLPAETKIDLDAF